MSNHGKRKSAFEDADNGRSAQTADGKRVKISVQIWGVRPPYSLCCSAFIPFVTSFFLIHPQPHGQARPQALNALHLCNEMNQPLSSIFNYCFGFQLTCKPQLRVLPGMTCPVLFERAFRLVQQAEGCKVVSDRRWARLVMYVSMPS